MDTLTVQERSIRMGKIKSSDTLPEMMFRKALYAAGIRYRKNTKTLPGKPDVTIKKYNLAIDIRGCFWHSHEACPDGHLPKTNSEFWRGKLDSNRLRDISNVSKLNDMGFKVFVVWECEIKNKRVFQSRLSEIYDYLEDNFQFVIASNSNSKIGVGVD